MNIFQKILRVLHEILYELKQPHTTRLFINFKNKNKMQTVEIGQLLEGTLQLTDNVTGQPVEGATYEGDEVTSSDENIFTVKVSDTDPSKLEFTEVGVGSASVHVKTNATYTNSKGKSVTESKEADADVTVEAAADGTTLSIHFPDAPQLP